MERENQSAYTGSKIKGTDNKSENVGQDNGIDSREKMELMEIDSIPKRCN